MDYEFDVLVSREHTGSDKFDGLSDNFRALGAITYGGAELDVKTAPCIREALEKRARNGIYGYTKPDEAYFSSVEDWMRAVRNWEIRREWIVPSYGTMQAACAAIRAFSDEGDGVIIQPPVYVLYHREIARTRRNVVGNPLLFENGRYRIDFNHLEQLMSQPKNKVMLLCNPHNPIMDHWEREDLETVAYLAEKHGVLVFCDEIFAEHVCGGILVPYAEVGGENCIVATSLGKAFNFTGSSHANVIIPGKQVREKYIEQRNYDHFGSIDPFIYTATLAAYTPAGKAWINELLAYSGENIRLLSDFLAKNLPQVTPCRHRAGTLVWVDFNALGLGEDALWDFLENEAAFIGDRGSIYGAGGSGFVRFQMGTPRSILVKALDRLRAAAERRKWTS